MSKFSESSSDEYNCRENSDEKNDLQSKIKTLKYQNK